MRNENINFELGVTAATFLVGGVMLGAGLVDKFFCHEPPTYKNPFSRTSVNVSNYDVDRDGLDDVVLSNGEIRIAQGDGTYKSPHEMWRKEAISLKEKYTFRKGDDGKYRTVGFGRVSQAEREFVEDCN